MSSEVMKREFPDSAQRSAICYSRWDKKAKAELIDRLCKVEIPK